MFKHKKNNIIKVVQDYFDGVFHGDIEKLTGSFHPNTVLYGDISGKEYLKSLDDYLDGVKQRKSPAELGEENKMDLISLEILGDVAVAKVHLPMLGYNYYDFLSLAVVSGQWKIVNKVFTHVE